MSGFLRVGIECSVPFSQPLTVCTSLHARADFPSGSDDLLLRVSENAVSRLDDFVGSKAECTLSYDIVNDCRASINLILRLIAYTNEGVFAFELAAPLVLAGETPSPTRSGVLHLRPLETVVSVVDSMLARGYGSQLAGDSSTPVKLSCTWHPAGSGLQDPTEAVAPSLALRLDELSAPSTQRQLFISISGLLESRGAPWLASLAAAAARVASGGGVLSRIEQRPVIVHALEVSVGGSNK
jgi:hypothetical protein